jgi:transcription antitermination protein NusB
LSARTKARKRALDVLYEADLMGLDPVATLAIRLAQADPPVPQYAVELVEGVVAQLHALDQLIASLAHDWILPRMPAIDRNVLRLGAYELLHRLDVPAGVAVSEAVELVGRLSTDESAAFVNGVLARVAERRPTPPTPPTTPQPTTPQRPTTQPPPMQPGGAASDGLDGAPHLG